MTLKEALSLPKEEVENLKKELISKIEAKKEIGAYVEQLTGSKINDYGEGIPIAIKDNIQVKGWEITSASKMLKGYISPYNATVIQNLLKNNLSPFGRTNMDEFAMGSSTQSSCYGGTLNPNNLKHSPGGSSGGSAAAVASGLAIAALGSDTGGSIRQPAAFCGCVGMKPTYGKVSRYGLGAYSSSLDQIGPITQNVEDAAILYDIIAGHEPKDSTSLNEPHKRVSDFLNSDKTFKIAVIENFLNEADEDIQKAMRKSIELLKSHGNEITYVQMPDFKRDVAVYYVISTAEASTNLSRFDGVRYGFRAETENLKELYEKSRNEGFGDEVKRRILLGTYVLSSGQYEKYYLQALKVREAIKQEYENIFKNHDLIFTPTTPSTAFEIENIKDPLKMYLSDSFTASINLANLPALSLPIGKDRNKLPIGGQIIAKAYDEQSLFDGALLLEKLLLSKEN